MYGVTDIGSGNPKNITAWGWAVGGFAAAGAAGVQGTASISFDLNPDNCWGAGAGYAAGAGAGVAGLLTYTYLANQGSLSDAPSETQDFFKGLGGEDCTCQLDQ